MQNYFKKIIDFLMMRPLVGGLEINDVLMRYVLLERGVPREVAVRLAPGIVQDGVIQNREAMLTALRQLHADNQGTFASPRLFRATFANTISVIVTISARNVYVQSFSLPYAAIDKLQEAAQLNLRMISPLRSDASYRDWHIIREEAASNAVELLGAFMASEIADGYQSVLREANFSLTALEFVPLSVARVVRHTLPAGRLAGPVIVVLAGIGGIDCMILRSGELYFNRYIPWPVATGDALSATIVADAQKVINYYFSKHGELITNFLVIDMSDRDDIWRAVGTLQGTVEKFMVPNAAVDSLPALGAAYRGLISRRLDKLISLTNTGTEEDYRRDRLTYSLRLWRNSSITTLGVVMIILLVAHGIIFSAARSAQQQLRSLPNDSAVQRVATLEETAREFNDLVMHAIAAQKRSADWLPIFNQLWFAARKTIVINRLHFSPNGGDLLIGGTGVSEIEIINFKNRVSKLRGFNEVTLPLSQIIREGDRVSFQMSIRVQ